MIWAIHSFILIKRWNHKDCQRWFDGDEGKESKQVLQIDWKSCSQHTLVESNADDTKL